MAIEDAYTLGALLADRDLDDPRRAFDTFEKLRKARTTMVQVYTRAAGRAYKLAGRAAASRDKSWPHLPERIGWIHGYRAEEAVAAVTGADAET
jgi:salicylate hydroxylase